MIIHIYALLEPDTNAVRYIGKSVNPEKRLYQHCHPDPSSKRLSAEWIIGLLVQGKAPKMILLEECGIDTWDEAERRWITHYKSIGAELTNVSPGGTGKSQYVCKMPTIAVSRQIYQWMTDQSRESKKSVSDVIRETIQSYSAEVGLFGEEQTIPYGNRKYYSHRLPMTSITREMRDWLEERANICDVGMPDVIRSAFTFCMNTSHS